MTGEKGGLLAGLRAEALKSRHAAPVRLAMLMALPMPLLGAMPYRGVQIFSAWNYWYALFLPVSLSLVVACVARADARTRMRGLLGLGFPLGRAWWAKALWCLALCTLSNLVVFGIYLAGSASRSSRDGGRHYGLGLHAASEAASAHGGSVSLANSPSGGAVATIAVPLCGA